MSASESRERERAPVARIREIRLQNFKGFRDAVFAVSDFTVVVGTNAAGKSNLRDAFRFLHGVSRGYTVAEILGEKWIEGGVLQWKGIRGGAREAAFAGASRFSMTVQLDINDRAPIYRIDVGFAERIAEPYVIREELSLPNRLLFGRRVRRHSSFERDAGWNRPLLLSADERWPLRFRRLKSGTREAVVRGLESIRFLDLSPDAM